MTRLPTIGSDTNSWGTVLNQFLQVGHNADGSLSKAMKVYNINDDAYGGNINTAATAAGNAGGGIVLVPPGTYTTSPITLQNRVWLMGGGMRSTIIKLANGSNDSLIKNYVSPDGIIANAEHCGVLDLMLDGNKANQSGTSHGIFFSSYPLNSQATNDDEFDTQQVVQNVFIKNALTDGYNATGRSATMLYNVQAYSSGRYGFNPSFDTFLVSCQAGSSGSEGFYLGASEVHLVNCTSFYSGQTSTSSGFHMVSNTVGGVILTNCVAQDNTGIGFQIDTTYTCSMTGCVADSNSTASAGTYPALDIWNSFGCIVEGLVCFERKANGSTSYQTHALRIRSTSTGNRISLTHTAVNGATISTPIDSGSTSLAGNDVRINSQAGFQTITYAASITPDPFVGNVVEVTLTGALTINAPGNGPYVAGNTLTFILIQDGTGGRVTTFNAAYKTNWTPVTTASKTNTITFAYDGTSWWQVSAVTGM